MLVLNILCHNLVGYESSRRLGTKMAECGYETPKPGNESSGYEKSMGTKRLVTFRSGNNNLTYLSKLSLLYAFQANSCCCLNTSSFSFNVSTIFLVCFLYDFS